jgi:hypothetical protein
MLEPAKFLTAQLVLLAIATNVSACKGQTEAEPDSAAQGDAPKPEVEVVPSSAWFGPADGPDALEQHFAATITSVPEAPRSVLAEHFPADKPIALVFHWNEIERTDKLMQKCLASVYVDKSLADFGKLMEAGTAAGWKKHELGDIVAFEVENAPDERPLAFAPIQELDPDRPEGVEKALEIEQCEDFDHATGTAAIKKLLGFDWRLVPVAQLAAELGREPINLHFGRLGDRATAGGSIPFEESETDKLSAWITAHGFVKGDAPKTFVVEGNGFEVELILMKWDDRGLAVLTITTPWPD